MSARANLLAVFDAYFDVHRLATGPLAAKLSALVR
jgi:hypothetical protein